MQKVTVFTALLLLATMAAAQDTAQYLKLSGRSVVDGYKVALTESNKVWLKKRHTLVLGVSVENIAPPFEFGLATSDYEGLIADYATLISQLLNVEFKVRQYSTHDQALDALKSGEIDILPMTRTGDSADPNVILTAPYSDDRQVLVSREAPETMRASGLAGLRVAVVERYRNPELLQSAFPGAEFRVYPSAQSAIGAVAFGKVDAYLGEAIRANYLINKSYLNDLLVLPMPAIDRLHFSFLLRQSDGYLLKLVNSAMAAIPLSERLNILRRWSAGGEALSSQFIFSRSLTQKERYWLRAHPSVKVVLAKNDIPLSFVDSKGRYRGITADALNKISLLTGMKFEHIYRNNPYVQTPNLAENNAIFLAGLAKSKRRSDLLHFTHPYMIEPIVLVTRISEHSQSSLEQMSGEKVAALSDSSASDFIRECFPLIQILEASSVSEMLDLLRQGKIVAAIGPLHTMRYEIKKAYADDLQISGSIDRLWMQASFAISSSQPLLYSILNKALLSISPKEIDDLSSRWQGDFIVEDSYWAQHREDIIKFLGIGLAALLTTLVWAVYLMREMRKRRRVERALREQMEFMHVVINGTPHPIYVRDRHGRMLVCNSGYLDTVNLKPEQVIGTSLADSGLDAASIDQLQEVYHYALKQGTAVFKDRILSLTTGQTLTVYHWVLPYNDDNGEVAGVICGWLDIGERQQLLNQLNEAKEEAETANRAKTTFLAIMSHEIRTPMNAVIGILELMLKSKKIRSADLMSLEVAAGAARELQNLVGDILDIARIESGRLSLAPARMCMLDIAESTVRFFEGGARQKGVHLKLIFDPAADCVVWGDALRIKQIVSNLLSNAIKFSSEGEVLFEVRALGDTTETSLSIAVDIKDRGIGITTEDQLKLFSPFSQASNNNQDGRNGSGLGLAICKSLCDMMGGTLTLSSELNRGTHVSFSFRLPKLDSLPALKEEGHVLSPPSKALNILIVDDYPANRILLTQQLEFLGHCVVSAENGLEGLSAWRRRKFEAVITDMNMPLMQGEELARAIRKEEHERGLNRCIIFGFTANARPEERDRCLLAGMDDCLFKPLQLKELSARLGIVHQQITEPKENEEFSDHDSIDITSLRELSRNDEVAIINLIEQLRKSNIEDLQLLTELAYTQDMRGISELAHRVKGGAQMIRRSDLVSCCEAVEKACQTQDAERLYDTVATLEQSMRSLKRSLETFSPKVNKPII